MEKRSYKILSLLKKTDKYMTAEALSASCLVSSKTILKDIQSLNSQLNSSKNYIEVVPSHGVKLIINDYEQFQSFYNSFDENICSPIEREEWIEKYLIELNTWIKSENLCDILFISPSCLSQNIRAVRQMLSRYDLVINQRPHYGIRIEGREFNKRLCLMQIYISHIDQRNNFPGIQFSTDELARIQRIENIVDQILTRYQIYMSQVSFQNLVIYVFISLQRIEKGVVLKATEQMIIDVARWSDSVASVEISELIKKEFGIEMKDQEIAALSIHIASNRIILHFDDSIHRIIHDYDVNYIVQQMIKNVKEKWQLDFSKDDELISRLQLHLIPLEVRSRYNVTLQNPLLDDIKVHNMLAYQLAVTACEKSYDYHGNPLAEEEIGYIALHFDLALHRLKMKSKKNVLIVSGLGRGTAHILAYHVNEMYGKYINRIEITDYIELRKYDLSEIELIISSIPLKQKYSVPKIEVNYYLNEDDKDRIGMLLNDQKPFHMSSFLNKKMFMGNICGNTREEIMDHLMSYLHQTDQMYQTLSNQEIIANTELSHMTAIQSVKTDNMKSELFVGIFEKPILWSKKRVQMIIVPIIGESSSEGIQKMYEEISKFVLKPEYIKRVCKSRSFDDLKAIFEDIECLHE